MQITDVKVRKLFNDDGPMKAIVSVTFDGQLALHDIKVIYARERLFVVMPSRKNPDNTYRDIVHPINAEFRSYVRRHWRRLLWKRRQPKCPQQKETIDSDFPEKNPHAGSFFIWFPAFWADCCAPRTSGSERTH